MFSVMRIYDDGVSGTEATLTISNALVACSIYLEDPECIGVKIWDSETGEILFDYWRENNA